MAFSDVIARLAVSLSLDTAAFTTGSRKAKQETTGLQGHMTKAAKAISAGLAGMVSWEAVKQLRDWTQAAVESVGGLGEQAAQLGVTTDALQEYRYAATQVGLASDEMDTAFAQLTRRMGDAALAGKGPVVDAFKALGISLADLKGKTAGDVIPLIADGMAKIEDPAKRASIAVDLFGKSGQKLATLLQGGSAEVNNLRQAAHDLGIVLSESDIQKADEVADKVAALRYVLEAQENKKLLENADSLLKYEQSVSKLKLGLIGASNTLQTWADQFDAFNQRNAAVMRGRWAQVGENFMTIGRDIKNAGQFIVNAIGSMVTGIGNWVGARLNAIWDGVKSRIDAVKGWFYGLYDAVIGHSYVPDLVDGIAAEMKRLDAVMVAPVTKATTKAQEAFRDMAGEIRSLLDRLFPEQAAALQYQADRALLGNIADPRARQDAQMALARERGAQQYADRIAAGGAIDFGGETLDDGIRRYEDGMKRLGERAQVTTVRVAKSFKDMADDTIAALDRVVNAKGFLGILEAVVGFGLQLGSIGAFGKSIAARVNAIPGHAAGTMSAGRGLALVGERGPELVNFRGGERVYNNRDSRAMMGGGVMEIRPSPLFEVYVDGKLVQAAPGMMRGGAAVAQSQLAWRQSRRVG